ncbi:hypothetical protein MLD38_025002 [Melastoma candidum]|uniref:Uncharacterized protein n=1 Tax=Melastoma candidum TaxID=119954 RepID=A0ACB9NVR1_9MYRT|nr:hypothetical protein MLD38_025002 [Melastoma candidum]
MASSAAPSPSEVLSLFRSLLRTAREFSDYNIREYMRRRTIDAFRENKLLEKASSVVAAYSDGRNQLLVAKRQSVVYSMYAPGVKSIMEVRGSSGD